MRQKLGQTPSYPHICCDCKFISTPYIPDGAPPTSVCTSLQSGHFARRWHQVERCYHHSDMISVPVPRWLKPEPARPA